MNNLNQLRQISQNREAFFRRKQAKPAPPDPIIRSQILGPPLTMDQILGTIHFITTNMDFQQLASQQPLINQANSWAPLNLVMLICLTGQPALWKLTLSAMGAMSFQKIIAVWQDDPLAGISIDKDIEQFITETPDWIVDRIHFLPYHGNALNGLWQAGLLEARRFTSEAVVIMKPGSLVTYNYLSAAMAKIKDGYQLIGSRNWLSVCLQDESAWNDGESDYIRLCQYNDNRLDNEYIGTGRVISTYLLHKMKWQLYSSQNPVNTGLDRHAFINMKRYEPSVYEIPMDAKMSVGIVMVASDPNSWLNEMIRKNKCIDYLIRQEVYAAAVRILYTNFRSALDNARRNT